MKKLIMYLECLKLVKGMVTILFLFPFSNFNIISYKRVTEPTILYVSKACVMSFFQYIRLLNITCIIYNLKQNKIGTTLETVKP